jgi:glyoxylase-like metal-dependent hydrolase (beta-lactamase superfamily II)
MTIKRFYSDDYYTNSYIIQSGAGKESIIVDPVNDSSDLKDIVEGLDIKFIFNTHGHFDHISGNSYFKKKTHAGIVIQSHDAPMLTDPVLNLSILFGKPVISPDADIIIEAENESLHVGDLDFSIKFFPGHTNGCMALYLEEENILISGDFIFQDSIGRMDQPSGSAGEMKNSLLKLFDYPEKTMVYPGHGLPFSLDEFIKNVYPEIIKEF